MFRFLLLANLLFSLSFARECGHVATHLIDVDSFGGRVDLSGLTLRGGRLFSISDLSYQNDILEIVIRKEGGAWLRVAQAVDGEWLLDFAKRTEKMGRVDFEGICHFGNEFWIASESTRSVLKVNVKGEVEELIPDFAGFHRNSMMPFSGIVNAGLEAIACDEESGRLWVFNERQFRMAYEVHPGTGRIFHQFDVPAAADLPRYSQGSWMYPDFAGADFDSGYLYLLERNGRRILKVDPESFATVDSCSYAHVEDGMYQEKGPFGVAEGLAVQDRQVYVVLDTNGSRQKSAEDTRPALFQLVF